MPQEAVEEVVERDPDTGLRLEPKKRGRPLGSRNKLKEPGPAFKPPLLPKSEAPELPPEPIKLCRAKYVKLPGLYLHRCSLYVVPRLVEVIWEQGRQQLLARNHLGRPDVLFKEFHDSHPNSQWVLLPEIDWDTGVRQPDPKGLWGPVDWTKDRGDIEPGRPFPGKPGDYLP